MHKPVNVAVIGCGVIAPTHIESYLGLEGVRVVALCDLVESKAKALAERYTIETVCQDYRQVLADRRIDGISVCTDHASHAPICVDALEAGKHVLCEKALAASPAGLDAMLAAQARHPELVFSGVFQHRFDSLNRLMRTLLDEGVFGTILTAGMQMRCLRTPGYYEADRWRGTWAEEGGSVLITQAIHFIDILAWLMGGVRQLCGIYDNLTHGHSIETEDTAVASLRFANGALGTIEATCSSHLGWEPTLAVHGTLGSVEIRNGQPAKVLFEDKGCEQEVRARLAAATDAPGVEAGKIYYGSGHAAQIADVVEAIRTGRPPYVTAAQARHTVDIVLAIYQSWQKNAWISL